MNAPTRIVWGVRPVTELVLARPRDVAVVWLGDGVRSAEIDDLVHAARDRAVAVEIHTREEVAEMAGESSHQGVVAIAGPYPYGEMGQLLALIAEDGRPGLLVLADGIQDPHNLGAVVRSAEVLGAHAVVVPDRKAAPVTGAVVKASAGATERLPVVRVGHILRTIDALREAGWQVLGASAGQGSALAHADLRGPTAFVVGNEGRGLRVAVARRCSAVVHVPQAGRLGSLNVSVAAAILLYEAARQRAGAGPADKGAHAGETSRAVEAESESEAEVPGEGEDDG